VQFSPTEFVAAYPEFAGLTDAAMAQDFVYAEILLNNTCCSRVKDANTRLTLLYMLTAHVAAILQGTNDGAGNITPPLGIVGRINTATEGDVSAGAEWAAPPNPSEAFFVQTKYGALFWQMTAQFRTALFFPAPPQAYNPLWGLGIGPFGPWGNNGPG
jgi:hypothetical protein